MSIPHAGFALAYGLIDHGIRYVFGLPGGQTSGLYNAIAHLAPEINHILIRDECAAAFAADGYARVTGKPGVCDATVGPGAVKLTSGLMEAYNSSIPILAIVSNIDTTWTNLVSRGKASQAVDQGAILAPIAKAVISVPAPEKIPELLHTALITAVSGRPGPVVLDIPVDVLSAPWPEDVPLPRYDEIEFPLYRPQPDPQAVDAAVDTLLRAERPLLVVGGGAWISGAQRELRQLVDALPIPVATTWGGKGTVPDTHPLNVGLIGATGTRAADAVRQRADVVLMVGAKCGQNSTFNWTFPSADQTLIHIDIDPEELGRVFRTEVPILGDAREALRALLARLNRARRVHIDSTWLEEVREAKARWEAERDAEMASAAIPIKPQRVMKAIADVMTADDLLVCDASYSSGWGGIYVPVRDAVDQRPVLFPRGAAGLGWGLPAAIGSWFAQKYRNIFVVAGDGAASYHLGELSTVRRSAVKVIYVILNNDNLGWSYWSQKLRFDGRVQSTDLAHIDFAQVARGFGIRGVSVTEPEQLDVALREAVASDESVVIDVRTELHETPILGYRDALARLEEARMSRAAY